mmetsp:Transcript_18370/g.55339  ORF Transcript_18370/g.55339 Transcript_18370/m.55339 type:complete len:263 (+) Transcript_18370:630-1418(+)
MLPLELPPSLELSLEVVDRTHVHVFRIIQLHSSVLRWPRWQHLLDSGNLGGCEGVRKCDVELHVKVALVKRVVLNGHALPVYALPAVRLDHLTRLCVHLQHAVVQVAYVEVQPAQRLGQCDGLLQDEVRRRLVDALEEAVLLLLQHEHHVARQHAGLGAPRLPPQRDLLPMLHALVNVDLEYLLLGNEALACAAAALVVGGHLVAGAAAARAGRLHLLHHAWRQGAQLDCDTLPAAGLALVLAARLGARARTGATLHVARQR